MATEEKKLGGATLREQKPKHPKRPITPDVQNGTHKPFRNALHAQLFVVLHLPLIWLPNSSHSIVTFVLQVDLQELLCCCSLNQPQICLNHEKF